MELVHWVADCMDQGLIQVSGFSAEISDHSFRHLPSSLYRAVIASAFHQPLHRTAAASGSYESTIALTGLDFKFIVAVERRDKFKCS